MQQIALSEFWRLISIDLWSRAARYAHTNGSQADIKRHTGSGFFFYSDLDEINKTGPQPGAWWWIYEPLLRVLVDGQASSPAVIVGLGHHTRIDKNHTDRQWIYFLPNCWDGGEGSQALAHLIWMASYNANVPEGDKPPLLLSTAVLDMLNDVNHLHVDHSPTLHPLLLDYAENGDAATFYRKRIGDRQWPVITADLSKVRHTLLEFDTDFQAQEMVRPYLTGTISTITSAGYTPTAEPRPFLVASQIAKEFQRDYRMAVLTRQKVLKSALRLKFPIFEENAPEVSLDARLKDWNAPETILENMLNFNLWIHDATQGRERDWEQLLTALSWWPSLVPGRRWSSIVAYLRPGALSEASAAGPAGLPHWRLVPDLAGAFAAASGYTAEEAARADEHAQADERVRIDVYLQGLRSTSPARLVQAGDEWGVHFGGAGFRLPRDDGCA